MFQYSTKLKLKEIILNGLQKVQFTIVQVEFLDTKWRFGTVCFTNQPFVSTFLSLSQIKCQHEVRQIYRIGLLEAIECIGDRMIHASKPKCNFCVQYSKCTYMLVMYASYRVVHASDASIFPSCFACLIFLLPPTLIL